MFSMVKSNPPRLKLLVAALATSSACVLVSPVHAAEVTIQDTSGFTRAVSEVQGSGSVQFDLVGSGGAAADGVPVTLTNSATGEVLTATSVNGVVVFDGVTPGVWTVATTSPGVTFTSVSVLGAVGTGGGITAGALIPAVAVGGAGAAAAIAISNDSDDNNEMSPSS
jgi:hypothetical protein